MTQKKTMLATLAAILIVSTAVLASLEMSQKDAIFLQLRHYLASIAAFIVTGFTIYLVEKNQIANQSENIPQIASKNIPQATESLRAAAPLAQSTSTVPPQITSVPAMPSDPMIVLIAVLGATAAFFAVFFGIWGFKKFKKNKK